MICVFSWFLNQIREGWGCSLPLEGSLFLRLLIVSTCRIMLNRRAIRQNPYKKIKLYLSMEFCLSETFFFGNKLFCFGCVVFILAWVVFSCCVAARASACPTHWRLQFNKHWAQQLSKPQQTLASHHWKPLVTITSHHAFIQNCTFHSFLIPKKHPTNWNIWPMEKCHTCHANKQFETPPGR